MGPRTLLIASLLFAVLLLAPYGALPERRVPQNGALPLTPGATTDQVTGDWPMFRHDPCHSGSTSEKLIPPLRLVWKYPTGQPIVSSPAVSHGRVYFGSRDSALHIVHAVTGKPIREHRAKDWIDSSPAVSGGSLYFASRDGYIYSLNPISGRLSWKYHTGGTDCSSPVVVNGVLYIASGYPNAHLRALSASSGQSIRIYETTQPVYSSPAVKDGTVYIGSNDGRFYALKSEERKTDVPTPSFELKWAFETGGGIYFSSPAISDSLIYCIPGDYDRHAYCLRQSDGSVKWRYQVPNQKGSKGQAQTTVPYGGRIEGAPSVLASPDWSYPFVYVSSPALAHGMVYFVSGYPEQYLYALHALTGSLVWRQPIGQATGLGFSSSPAVADLVVYAGSGDGTLYALDAITGSPLWSYDTQSPILSSPVVARNRLYVGTFGGDLYCFQSRVGSQASMGDQSGETPRMLPKTHGLLSPVPNPFTRATTIFYSLTRSQGGEEQSVNLSVYDSAGRLIKNLVDAPKAQGYYMATWDGTDFLGKRVEAGVYFVRMTVSDWSSTRKIALMR